MRIVYLAWRITNLWSVCLCRRELNWFTFNRASSRKNLKIAKVYKRVKSLPVQSFRKKLEMAKDSRVEASSRRSENSTTFILNWSCFKWITFMTRRWQLPLWFQLFSSRFFQNLPPPPKHYGVFDVFADFQSFFWLENSGSHLAMSTDDRFLPQGKQILRRICQLRPMPKAERNGGDVASKAAPKILMIRWNSSELLISRLLELAENSTEKSFSFLFFSLLELRDTIRTISFNQQLCLRLLLTM